MFRTFTISNGQTRSDHVRVSDSFHFVDIVALDASIEQLIDRIEERHHLKGMRILVSLSLISYENGRLIFIICSSYFIKSFQIIS